ncbi:MAG: sigma-70 family RNA polymerase sigma factor [Candidatus Omnitrophica bacterium]|nr:sigma-70 family RNA polymerase sigma factor [Candidatus Omnitrophota bacterium]
MDAIKLYLKDIRTLPLLTPKQEKDIARKVVKGDKKARQKMIKSNLRLVINIAKKYSYLGVPMLDLIEEGNLGLMKAVNKYDPEKGYRFSTYAAWWIKQYITRAVANQGKTVRIPVYVMEMLMRFQKVKRHLAQVYKKNPQLSDIAKKMKLPMSRVKQLNRMVSNITSLNAPIGESGGSEFMDLIEDESIVTAVDELSKFLLQERIEGLLEKMTPREKKILTLRFGLEDGVPHTLRDTAKHFGITRERVRQIEAACMLKLRKMMEDQEKDAEKRLFSGKRKKKAPSEKKTIRIMKKVAGPLQRGKEKKPKTKRLIKSGRKTLTDRRKIAADRRRFSPDRRNRARVEVEVVKKGTEVQKRHKGTKKAQRHKKGTKAQKRHKGSKKAQRHRGTEAQKRHKGTEAQRDKGQGASRE